MTETALPRTWRPFGPRIAAAVFGVILVAAFGWLWVSFDDQTRADVSGLQKATVLGFVLLGLLLLNGMARSRITATEEGLVVVNGYKKRELAWAQVVRVSMTVGAPWPTFDLDDGTTLSGMGIHGSDGARAKAALIELKALVDGR